MPLDFTKKNSENNKSNHVEYIIQSPKYQLENIVLSNEQECGIRQVLAYMEYKELLLKTWGLEKFYPESRGVFINLYGASGTGKTAITREITEKLGIPFTSSSVRTPLLLSFLKTFWSLSDKLSKAMNISLRS